MNLSAKLAFAILSICITTCYILISVETDLDNSPISGKYPKKRPTTFFQSAIEKVSFDENTSFKRLFQSKVVTDPTNVFYGLLPGDVSGLPLNYHNMSYFTFNIPQYEHWSTYFPGLMKSIEKNNIGNINRSREFHTSPEKTSVTIVEHSYKLGEYLTATIQARDQLGRNKISGGDYFRVRLIQPEEGVTHPKNGIACKVVDHNNGTYTVTAPLVLTGKLALEVRLMLSVEALSVYISLINERNYGYYDGTLKSGESVICNTHLEDNHALGELCDYSHPTNQEPWFCKKPPSGICHPLRYTVFQNNGTRASAVIKREFNVDANIEGSGATIDVLNGDILSMGGTRQCTIPFRMPNNSIEPVGYIKNGKWVSLLCKSTPVKDYFKCFKNKIVYFLGDSTIRQFPYLFMPWLKMQLKTTAYDGKSWQAPKILYNAAHNITFYYRSHGLPIQNPGPPESMPYIADTLDAITHGGLNVTIIFNVGAHLHKFDPSVFIHRMHGIRNAITRLHERLPGTRVVIRGLNVLGDINEWLFYRYDVIYREMFKELQDKVFFLNMWDLTTVWPLSNNYHPNQIILTQEGNWMLDMLCG